MSSLVEVNQAIISLVVLAIEKCIRNQLFIVSEVEKEKKGMKMNILFLKETLEFIVLFSHNLQSQ